MYIVAENSEQAGTQARQRAGHEEGGRCAGKGMHGKVIYHAAVFMHVLVCKSSLKVGACQSGLRGASQSLQSQTKPFKKMLPSQVYTLGCTRATICASPRVETLSLSSSYTSESNCCAAPASSLSAMSPPI